MKYNVTVSVNYNFEVDADTLAEAEELAADKYYNSAEVGEITDIYVEEEN